MKKTAAFIMLLFLSLTSHAGGRAFLDRFHPGIEWGYSATPARYHHFNYLDESIGFRIDEEAWENDCVSNAYFLGKLSFDISRSLRISAISGYEGVDTGVCTIPLSGRMEYAFSGFGTDGFLVFGGAGAAFISANTSRQGKRFEIGVGHRYTLAPHTSLGIRVGGRMITDKPDVWDPISEQYISERNIKRNDARYYALEIGIELSF